MREEGYELFTFSDGLPPVQEKTVRIMEFVNMAELLRDNKRQNVTRDTKVKMLAVYTSKEQQ